MKKLILFLLLLAPTGYALNQIKDVDVASNAGIQFSKLASLASGKVLAGNASNVATAVTPAGEVTMDSSGSFGLSNAAVIAKVITGFASGAGTVGATDSILAAIQKLDGNIGTKLSTTLSSGKINVGNGSNVATPVFPSGDVTMDSTGAFVIGAAKVSNSKLANASTTVNGVSCALGSTCTIATGGGNLNAKFTLSGAIVQFVAIDGAHYQAATQSLTTVNLSCLNAGSSGSTVFQVNQYRSGALQGSATASLSASSSAPSGSAASLSGTLSLLAGDVITVDINSGATGASDCSLEY